MLEVRDDMNIQLSIIRSSISGSAIIAYKAKVDCVSPKQLADNTKAGYTSTRHGCRAHF